MKKLLRVWLVMCVGLLCFSGAAFAQQTAQQALTLTVTAPNLLITTATLPNVVQNTAYNQTIQATGGVAPYTFSVSSGNLPTGITLSAAGILSGTPPTTGTYNFTVQVADSETPAATKTQAYTVIVIGKLVFTTSTLPPTLVGQPYTANVSFTGGIAPYTCTVSVGSLPSGLTITTNGLNCVISGTPTSVGTTPFTVQVASAQ